MNRAARQNGFTRLFFTVGNRGTVRFSTGLTAGSLDAHLIRAPRAWARLLVAGCLLLSAWGRMAAEELQRVFEPPVFGTFYLLSPELAGTPHPPYPFDPYQGSVPVYELDGARGFYLVADSLEDYQALTERRFLPNFSAESGGMSLMESGGPPPVPGEGSGEDPGVESAPPAYLTSTNVCLLPPVGTGSNAIVLTITNAEPGAAYDLLSTTNLAALAMPALSLTNWLWLDRGEPGQTNFVVAWLPSPESYYVLGRMADSDEDGLTDALENLVFHTDPQNPDTDGDEVNDYDEWLIGRNPLAAGTVPDSGGALRLRVFTLLR